MYQLRGFVPIASFADSTVNTVAAIGELSALSRSFSRDINFFRVKESADVALGVFYSTRDDVAVPAESTYCTILLNMSQWLFEQSIGGDLSTDPAVVIQALNAAFIGRARTLGVGEIISNGRYWFPSSLTCEIVTAVDDEDTQIKIWYADNRFQQEYDKYEHVPVPPPDFDYLDDFFLSPEIVIERIKKIDAEAVNQQNNRYRGDYPETKLSTTNYDYINPLDPEDAYPVPWSIFIYGLQGVNSDLERETLVDFVLGKSKHPREDWEKIFPDWFSPTEFYLIPFWDLYSLPDDKLTAGFYSPTIPLRTQYPTAKKYCVGEEYTEEYIQSTVSLVANLYRSLQFLAIGNPKNRNAPYKFEDQWPMYAVISTTSLDFGRIPVDTRTFMVKLTELLQAAEAATATSIVPDGLSRVVREDIVYMTLVLNKVHYVMPIKYNFESVE